MDEKDKQLYEATLVVESAKQTAELGKEVVSDVIRPTSKSIGKNIGLLIDGAFGWLGVWGEKQKIKQQLNLDEFKKTVSENLETIPEENIKEPTMYIIGPAIEASKFYYEENYFREMFAKLIAASCDNRCNDKISPYFVDAIKQITYKEATILTLFKNCSNLPIVNYNLRLKNGGLVYYNKYIFIHDNQNINYYSDAIVNLQRLGFVTIDFMNCYTDDKKYQKFIDNQYFVDANNEILKGENDAEYIVSKIDIEKGLIEITPLGKNFIDLCL